MYLYLINYGVYINMRYFLVKCVIPNDLLFFVFSSITSLVFSKVRVTKYQLLLIFILFLISSIILALYALFIDDQISVFTNLYAYLM